MNKEKNINIVIFGVLGVAVGILLSNSNGTARKCCVRFAEKCKSNIKFLIKGINIDDFGGECHE